MTKLLKQGYRYHLIRKVFSKIYHRHSEFIVKYNIGLKILLQQGISEPLSYDDFVYKFKRKFVGKPNFSDQFKKIVKRHKKKMDTIVCMPGCKPNHGLYLWFPLTLHDGGSGFRLNDGSDEKLLLVGRCLMLGCSWVYRG